MQLGIPGAARNKPPFHWARNLLSNYQNYNHPLVINYLCIIVYVLLWNMCSERLSSPIIDDYYNFLEFTRITDMTNQSGQQGYYNFQPCMLSRNHRKTL